MTCPYCGNASHQRDRRGNCTGCGAPRPPSPRMWWTRKRGLTPDEFHQQKIDENKLRIELQRTFPYETFAAFNQRVRLAQAGLISWRHRHRPIR